MLVVIEAERKFTTQDIANAVLSAATEELGREPVHLGTNPQTFIRTKVRQARAKARFDSREEWTNKRVYDSAHTAAILDALTDISEHGIRLQQRNLLNNGAAVLADLGITPQAIRRAEVLLFQPEAEK